jgi:cysteine-rich repeat protein
MTGFRLIALMIVTGLAMGGCGDDDGGGTNNVNSNENQGVCGDGILDTGEACDDGAANSDSTPDACRTDCRSPWCGDGVTDAGEQCDDGGDNSDTEPDACREGCVDPTCGDGVTDTDAGEECDDGNLESHDRCSSGCTEEALRWRDLEVTVAGQMDLFDAAMAYDANRDRMVLFGGRGDNDADATWEFDGQTWTETNPVDSPTARAGHAMVWDAVRGVVVLFGGRGVTSSTTTYQSDTWEYDGTDWTERTDLSMSPPARSHHAMAYDELSGLILLQGGENNLPIARLDDTWQYDGVTWTPQGNQPLLERTSHAMAYDPTRNVVVLFGGERGVLSNKEFLNDTWEWDGVEWVVANPTVQPEARSRHGLAFDSRFGRVVLFGGVDDGGDGYRGDTWLYDGTTWLQVAPTAPSARADFSMAHDSLRERVVLFGGRDGVLPTAVMNDTWVTYAGSAWPDEVCDSESDDDLDGLTDCEDPDCDGQVCASGICVGGVCQ